MSERRAVWMRRVVAGLALAWASSCFLADGWLRLRRPNQLVCAPPRASSWAPGCPAAQRLGRFLQAATAGLPPGCRLAFAGPPNSAEQHFFYLWAAYLLPEFQVDAVADRPDLRYRVDYVVSYRGALAIGILVPERKLRDGWLYRIEPAARPAPPPAGPP